MSCRSLLYVCVASIHKRFMQMTTPHYVAKYVAHIYAVCSEVSYQYNQIGIMSSVEARECTTDSHM